MDKSYVTLEQKVCPACGKTFDSGALLLDQRLRPKFDMHTTTGFELCPEHKEAVSKGFIIFTVVDPAKSTVNGDHMKPEDAYRTGEIIMVKREAASRIFNTQITTDLAFIDTEAAAKLHKIAEWVKAHG